MHNTKLIYLLKSLDQQEIRKLELFVKSPFVNKNETLSALFGLLSKYHPAYESPQLAKEKIFTKLFPGEKFKDERMRYLNSELLAVAEEFLVYNSYANDPIEKQNRLLLELNKRKLDSLFEMRKKEMERQIANTTTDTKSLLQKFQLEEVAMHYFHRKLMGKADEQIKAIDYSELIKSLTSFYLGYSLKMYVAILGQGMNYKKENPFQLLEETLDVLQQEMGEQPELVQLHSACLKLLKTNEERYYFEIRDKLLVADSKVVSLDEQINFMIIITNFCLRKYKEGQEKFLAEMNRLNKFSIERKLFLRDKKMSPIQYSNIVILSIDGNDTEWLDDFIEDYSVYLPEDVRESTTSFAKANLAYHKKNYKSALTFLSNAKYESPVRQTGIKNLLLKIYYEKNETELILPLIDSYLHVIKNSNVLTDTLKEQFRNFIRIYQSLYRAKQNKDKKLVLKVNDELKKVKQIAQRTWLQSKINELLK